MNNMKIGPLGDDDLRLHVANLDRVRVGLIDLQAAPELDDAPVIQQNLDRFSKIVRAVADALADQRDAQHLHQLRKNSNDAR